MVSRNIFILSLPSIAFQFHLIKAGRLDKNGHRAKAKMLRRKREWVSCGPALSFTKESHQLMKYCLQAFIIFCVNLNQGMILNLQPFPVEENQDCRPGYSYRWFSTAWWRVQKHPEAPAIPWSSLWWNGSGALLVVNLVIKENQFLPQHRTCKCLFTVFINIHV